MYKKARAAALQFAAIWGSARWAGVARRAVSSQLPLSSNRSSLGAGRRQLLVDVSIIAGHDAGTGIQRVIRALLLELLRDSPPGFEVRPVRATRKTAYRYANAYLSSLGVHASSTEDSPLRVGPGDIFLGLDLSSRIAPRRQSEFLRWRAQGVRFAFVVYDLLPALHPEWFTPRARKSFRHWLRTVSVHADVLCCISRSVADETAAWLWQHCSIGGSELAPRWFHLGAELPVAQWSAADLGEQLQERGAASLRQSVLMVGTVEPRKGHEQVLDAFEHLWAEGHGASLVIAGREGWHVASLAQRLRTHPEAGKRLVWLTDVNDAQLAGLYSTLGGLLMASQAEGFGLPLVEAAHYGMPILARDLPVFREVAVEHASYFTGQTGAELAPQLADWLGRLEAGDAPLSHDLRRHSWRESAQQLKTLLADIA
ncbi:glycosyltransferase family 4 protein [Ralstonia flatus]|nr:glycosyltransferase family 1 protein [Ralstonia sp. LMG 32965]MBN6209045.1 glycosyltransferase family 4 protein [Ralstonia pickettii]